MASTSELYRRRQGTSLTACPPAEPICSTCGMLECICRPRFFAGQVLNADDLNRLDAYIRAKHRLHNRQLHGWGVVNGLEVMCNPCGDGVAVGCGYALSPCGDDIVVCDAVTVAVCDLIRRCKDAEAKCGPCTPFQHPQLTACDAAEEEWILAIRYAEKPQRGVKPLYAPAQADCGCSCGKANCSCGGGGTTKTGCGCGAKTAAQCSCGTAAKPRGAPVQCEATVVCEGFEFEVYRRDKATDDANKRGGLNADSPLIARFRCCYDDLITKAPKMPEALTAASFGEKLDAWYLWACRFQAHLLRHYERAPGYNCALLARLSGLVIVQPGLNKEGALELVQAIQLMLLVVIDALFACLCSALLTPCPAATTETRVPLAVVHVAMNPCRVVRVCNWVVERKIATTFPALQYWLSVLPYGAGLRRLLQTLCCSDVTLLFRDTLRGDADRTIFVPRDAPNAAGAGAADAATSAAPKPTAASELFHQHGVLRLNPTLADAAPLHDASMLLANVLASAKPLDPELLMNTLLAQSGQGNRLPEVDSANLPQFLLLNQIVKPMAQAAFGSFGGLAGAAFFGGDGGAVPSAPSGVTPAPSSAATAAPSGVSPAPSSAATAAPRAPEAPELKTLRDEIARLHATVERHASEIEHLRGAAPAPRPKKGHR